MRGSCSYPHTKQTVSLRFRYMHFSCSEPFSPIILAVFIFILYIYYSSHGFFVLISSFFFSR